MNCSGMLGIFVIFEHFKPINDHDGEQEGIALVEVKTIILEIRLLREVPRAEMVDVSLGGFLGHSKLELEGRTVASKPGNRGRLLYDAASAGLTVGRRDEQHVAALGARERQARVAELQGGQDGGEPRS